MVSCLKKGRKTFVLNWVRVWRPPRLASTQTSPECPTHPPSPSGVRVTRHLWQGSPQIRTSYSLRLEPSFSHCSLRTFPRTSVEARSDEGRREGWNRGLHLLGANSQAVRGRRLYRSGSRLAMSVFDKCLGRFKSLTAGATHWRRSS